MNELIELKNLEINEYCWLNKATGQVDYSKTKQIPGFTGLYFRDISHFFALYPSTRGPIIYYKGKEYELNQDLSISLIKDGKSRKFVIPDYDIEIEYVESPYIGIDNWSEESDVDLFFMIAERYKKQSFYDMYTI